MNEQPIDITCEMCGAKWGEYRGPQWRARAVSASDFVRVDGSSPLPFAPATEPCTQCGKPIEIITRTLDAMRGDLL